MKCIVGHEYLHYGAPEFCISYDSVTSQFWKTTAQQCRGSSTSWFKAQTETETIQIAVWLMQIDSSWLQMQGHVECIQLSSDIQDLLIIKKTDYPTAYRVRQMRILLDSPTWHRCVQKARPLRPTWILLAPSPRDRSNPWTTETLLCFPEKNYFAILKKSNRTGADGVLAFRLFRIRLIRVRLIRVRLFRVRLFCIRLFCFRLFRFRLFRVRLWYRRTRNRRTRNRRTRNRRTRNRRTRNRRTRNRRTRNRRTRNRRTRNRRTRKCKGIGEHGIGEYGIGKYEIGEHGNRRIRNRRNAV